MRWRPSDGASFRSERLLCPHTPGRKCPWRWESASPMPGSDGAFGVSAGFAGAKRLRGKAEMGESRRNWGTIPIAVLLICLLSSRPCGAQFTLHPHTQAAADSALIGAAAGAYTAAWAAFAQGAGGGRWGAVPWLGAGFMLGALAGGAAGYLLYNRGLLTPARPPPVGPFDPIDPQAGQIDLQIENLSGFTGPGSIVRVREFSLQGT